MRKIQAPGTRMTKTSLSAFLDDTLTTYKELWMKAYEERTNQIPQKFP